MVAYTLSENDDRGWRVTVINTITDILKFNYRRYFLKRWISKRGTLNGDDRLDEIEIVRSLFQRYVELPLHLKQCFEYCRLFPKDYEIDVHTLINLWMAQGFIKLLDAQYQCLEDVGRKYFMDLVKEGFLKEVDQPDHSMNSVATNCKIDRNGYNLLIIIGGRRYVLLHPPDKHYNIGYPTTHHVSFDFHLHSPRQIPEKMKHDPDMIRSILLPRQSLSRYEQGMIDQEKILHIAAPKSIQGSLHWRPGLVSDAIISTFRRLGALDLHELGIKVVPYDIEKLKHLRYLDLSRNAYIKCLPASITKLKYLQTLKLSDCIGLEELPNDIKNLVNLRSLEIDGCYNLTHMPRGLGQLTNLLVLPQFVVNNNVDNSRLYSRRKDSHSAGGLNELRKLDNLRGGLQIKNLTPGKDAKAAVLRAKQHLQVLSLDWDIDQSENHSVSAHESQLEDLEPHLDLKGLTLHGYGGKKLSSWLNPQRNLVKLTLRKCSRCECLPALDQFPSLKVLVLDEMRNLQYINSEDNPACKPFFPELQELQLAELPQLKGWWSHGAFSYDDDDFPSFPRLSKLSIQDCPELHFMPLFPTLEDKLELDTTSWVPFQGTMKRRGGALPLMNLSLVNIKDFNKGEVVEFTTWDALRVLSLDFIPELEELLEVFQEAPNLQELSICRCSISSIPKWIGDLESLEKLAISVCPTINSLPKEISNLTNLKTLEIEDCPTLLQRCQRETGADWDKIAHIPNKHFWK